MGKAVDLPLEVTIELVRMKCLPILLYGLEACPLVESNISSLDYIIHVTFDKVFNDRQQEIINECRMSFNSDYVNQVLENRQLKLIAKFSV